MIGPIQLGVPCILAICDNPKPIASFNQLYSTQITLPWLRYYSVWPLILYVEIVMPFFIPVCKPEKVP